jgi:uncharacterized protein YndB with AHSA1/START domain
MPSPDREPEGKTRTDRAIVLKAVVDAPAERVYELWTTTDGVRSFFGTDAVIEAKKGGRYEVYFLPRSHPESDVNSSKGARVLWIDPGRGLAFEWMSPPFASELNEDPLPLWVEVRLTPLEIDRSRTIVELASHGYGRSEQWDRVYEFFVRNWGEVLYRLDRVVVDPDFQPSW